MPTEWTRELVCSCLEDAFRRRVTLSVYSRWNIAPVITLLEVEITLNWETRFRFLLGEHQEGWTYLRMRARCRARAESLSACMREFGVKRKRFDAGWQGAADAIAAGLNEERINQAALLAGKVAKTRLEREGRIEVTRDGVVRRGRAA